MQTVARNCGHKSLRAFALAAGLNPIAFGENIRKAKEPRFSTLEAILKANPQISAEWLMRGEGDMFRTGEGAAANVMHIDKLTRSEGGDGVSVNSDAIKAYASLVEQLRKENAALNERVAYLQEREKVSGEQIRNKDAQIAKLLDLLAK